VIALGHIAYANCFPVHGPILLGDVSFGGEIVSGEPAALNRLLATGRVQVAPCSSIEYARNHPRYRVLPDLGIVSRGEVRSILLGTTRDPEDLGRCRVATPTASASSTCLAEILLLRRYGASPQLGVFDQQAEDPFENFEAALFIGDVALATREERPDLIWTDLGAAWTEWTGLPFVYALWQVHAPPALSEDVQACGRALAESKAAGLADLEGLSRRYPVPVPLPRSGLADYWRGLDYGLDAEAGEGLRVFFEMAVDIGRLRSAPDLQFLGEVEAPAPI
jgi:chorismate dehydratase